MSELSERSGVAVATVKYYLREGLLPPGESVGATRARYDANHVERLRLIRALVDVAGLSLERVRRVLAVVDDEAVPLDVAIGSAHGELSPEVAEEPSQGSSARVASLIRRRRWQVDPEGRHARALAAALDALEAAGQPFDDDALAAYAQAARSVAGVDVAGVRGLSRDRATSHAVIGTVLAEPVLITLRRMAQEDLARRRLGRTPTVTP
ncbi:MerR family transcriptional regulator [Nocardioides sp. GCM10027113]|uniref:MerR family transcriptional regulator n=1 Tax=unclassified Nocardioides TaxID=2615069 RepID=UPI00360CF29C